MCTVIYIPVRDGYLLCSCRDESKQRKNALPPGLREWGQGTLLCPLDTKAGGTWIAATERGETAVLFNGAFTGHVKREDYKTSRGVVLSRLLGEKPLMENWKMEDLEEVEPFSVIHATASSLYRLSWDGNSKYKTALERGKSYIWSSVTLYPPLVRYERERVFSLWVAQNGAGVTTSRLLDFLHHAMPGDTANRYIMRRGETQTVSITVLHHACNRSSMFYQDLKTGSTVGQIHPEKISAYESLEKAATDLV